MSSLNFHFPNKEKITLSDISARKEELLVEIRKQQDLILTQAKAVTNPVTSVVNSSRAYVRPFQLGFGAISAFQLGWKVFRNLRKIIKRIF